MIKKEYKIREFDKTTGRIKVEYLNHPLITIQLHLNVHGKYPEGDDLDRYVSGFLPNKDYTSAVNIGSIETKIQPLEKPALLPNEKVI